MDEGAVYYYAKTILREAGVNVFGGEPPGGSDELHRIELKDPEHGAKGSRGSRKFDLVAHHLGAFILIELKDDASKLEGDVRKLDEVVSSDDWIGAFWDNLSERRLLGRRGIPDIGRRELARRKSDLFVRALGAPPSGYQPPDDYILLEVGDGGLRCRAGGDLEAPTLRVYEDLRERLRPFWF